MKLKKACSYLLLFALLLSALSSCGFAAPMTGKPLDLSDYPDEALAENTAVTSNLGDLRVMSYNVLTTMNSNSTLKQNRYQAVLQEIRSYSPVLLGLQEDASHWNTFLTEQLVTNGTYKRINSSVGSGEYCSIYYDTKVLGTPIASGAFWLTHTGKSGANALRWEDVPQRHRDALAMTQASHMRSSHAISCYIDGKLYTENDAVLDTRLMSYGIFELNGQKFLYANTHLQHRSQNGKLATNIPEFLELREMERKAEWDILTQNIENLLKQYGDMPVIITGDLNDVMGSASYYHFATHYDNASKLAKLRKGHDASWNTAFSSSTNGKINSTIVLKDGLASTTLDYCFISPGDFTVEQYQTGLGRQKITNAQGETGYVYCSDHLPIIIDLSFGKDASAPTVNLQRPGMETSAVSHYDPQKGADTSWYDSSKPDGEYRLTTANQLAGFLELRQKSSSCKMKIKLGANMVLGNLAPAWQSSDSSLFEGTFDGQGHYVSFTSDGASLLGTLGDATVKDLAIVNSTLRVTSSAAQNGCGSFASAVAENKTASFYNLSSNCAMIQGGSAENVGGIVGLIGKNAKIELLYCTYSGAIEAADCNAVAGLVGSIESGVTARFANSANAGNLVGDKYTGGLIGISRASTLYISNCANVGDITAGRCSGGLVGCLENCQDLILSDCAVIAKLDFSSIGAGGTEKDPVSVPAGCQVGGLIGRTYDVQGNISGITLAGSMKGAANLITKLDKDNNNVFVDYTASGAITGFNSVYADDEKVMSGEKVLSYLHYDTILVTMEMTDVESYLGGTRDTAIDTNSSRISHRDIVYDKEKFAASGLPLWGARIDQNRRIDDAKEVANGQLDAPVAYTTSDFYINEVFDAKVSTTGAPINHYIWMPKFSAWQTLNGGVMVSSAALCDVVESAMQSRALCVVGYQIKVNEDDVNKIDFRFVSVMQQNAAASIGYRVTFSYVNETGSDKTIHHIAHCETVYPSIKGGDQHYSADQYDGVYFMTLVIEGIPVLDASCKDLTVILEPFAIERDGEKGQVVFYNEKLYFLN